MRQSGDSYNRESQSSSNGKASYGNGICGKELPGPLGPQASEKAANKANVLLDRLDAAVSGSSRELRRVHFDGSTFSSSPGEVVWSSMKSATAERSAPIKPVSRTSAIAWSAFDTASPCGLLVFTIRRAATVDDSLSGDSIISERTTQVGGRNRDPKTTQKFRGLSRV